MTENKYVTGIYRIYDRFYISKRGPVYMLDRELVSTLKLNDIMYDSKRNRFKVSGIEHFSGQFLIDNDDRPIGVLFDMIDGKEVQGGVMIKDIDIVEIPADTAILGGDPLPWLTVEQMWKEVDKIQSVQELVDEYAAVHNKFWYIEDNIYDYEEGTEEYKRACHENGEWADIMNHLLKRVMEEVDKEGFMYDFEPGKGYIKQLARLMDKYGYDDGNGWWIAKKSYAGE